MTRFLLNVNGIKKEVEVTHAEGDMLKVKVNGTEYIVTVEILEQALQSPRPAPGGIAQPQVSAPAPASPEADVSVVHGSLAAQEKKVFVVKSPLPGVVSSVEAPPGKVVDQGEILLYIESMKMLNDIVSPARGRVVEIKKGAGETVNIGDPLVVIEVEGE
ncbi:MAG: acetyl-CoA carboxylase biotin carboxyl carrier protein subunit [Candidatus Methanosuratus sp.]|nr:acetyl-CoA carboxylase biotin carboxyl carrier protein subunit [Candidatus Methanosuratincola sp.]